MPNLRNALSDYGQWSKAHPWKSAAIGFVPVVGQAQGVADTAEALNRKAYGEAGFNALMTVFPFGRAAKALKGRMGIVAGEAAKTANKEALEKAQALARLGTSREDIHATTGWWQGPDKKWRFEIDDSGARLNMDALPQGKSVYQIADWKLGEMPSYQGIRPNARIGNPKVTPEDQHWALSWAQENPQNAPAVPLSQAFQHPLLADAYGDLGGVKIGRQDGLDLQGSFDRATNEIRTGGGMISGDPRSTALHEIQHVVQETEGFAKGGNIENAPILDMDAISAIRTAKNQLGIDPYAIMNKKAGGYPLQQYEIERLKKWEELTAQEDELLAARLDPYEAYRRLAGEAEARAVQARQHMTAQQRRARPFWEDFDVPESEQIIR